MAIRMMVSKEEYEKNPNNVEVVLNYSGSSGTLYMRTTHVGKVISLREHNGYSDSDYYALVWNDETNSTEEIEYATTRGWTYPNGASVDATEEVKAKYDKFTKEVNEKRRATYLVELNKMPEIGDTIKIVKGRKIAIDTVAEVFWVGQDKFYRESRYSSPYSYLLGYIYTPEKWCIGIRLLDGTRLFTNAKNLEIVKKFKEHK